MPSRPKNTESAISRRFLTERQLQIYIATLEQYPWSSASVTRVRREFQIGECIPDVLIVNFVTPPPPELWPRRWTYRHACVLAQLRTRGTCGLADLASALFDTEDHIVQAVRDLARTGAVRSTGTRTHLTQSMLAVRAEVTAIEAKLDRWQEAIRQASVYQRFADRVIVALDEGATALSKEQLRTIRETGVGLWRVGQAGIKVPVAARLTRSWSAEREYIIASAASSRSEAFWMRR